MPGQPDVHDHHLGAEALHGFDHVLTVLDGSHELKIGGQSEHEAESLPHRRVVVDGETAGLSSDIGLNPMGPTANGHAIRPYDARVFSSMVVGTDGSETASEAVRQAAELAQKVGAKVHLVSAYEPVPEGRLREERQQVPGDLQWMVNPREDVSETLEEAAGELRDAGVDVETHAREGDPADAILDVAEEERRRPDRGRQQGHDRRQALPARQRAEQGLASRSLQRDDHPDDLARA